MSLPVLLPGAPRFGVPRTYAAPSKSLFPFHHTGDLRSHAGTAACQVPTLRPPIKRCTECFSVQKEKGKGRKSKGDGMAGRTTCADCRVRVTHKAPLAAAAKPTRAAARAHGTPRRPHLVSCCRRLITGAGPSLPGAQEACPCPPPLHGRGRGLGAGARAARARLSRWHGRALCALTPRQRGSL